MPAEIDSETRSRIVYFTALGYSQREVSRRVGVSRNTIRKYLERTREAVEDADDPQRTLCAILEDEYEWREGDAPEALGLGNMPM